MHPPVPPDAAWQSRLEAAWARLETMDPAEFVATIDALAAERGDADAFAAFERACARDSVGDETGAEPLYRAALAAGRLDAYRRARATLQLASTLRILGRLEESETLLVAELDRQVAAGEAALRDEARAILAFTWLAMGRAEAAAGLALATLAPKLTRYQRSMARNAARIAPRTWT